MKNIIHVIVNATSIVEHVIQIKNETMINASASVKSVVRSQKFYSWNCSTCICENGKYLEKYC